MCAQLVVALVVETFFCCVFDRAVHAFDLAVCPRVIGLSKPVLYAVSLTDHVEAHWPGIDCIAVPWLLCELDTAIGENGVDPVGHGTE